MSEYTSYSYCPRCGGSLFSSISCGDCDWPRDKMTSHDEFKEKCFKNPKVRKEYEALEPEFAELRRGMMTKTEKLGDRFYGIIKKHKNDGTAYQVDLLVTACKEAKLTFPDGSEIDI